MSGRKPRRAPGKDRPCRSAAAVERLDHWLGRWLAPLVVAVAALRVAVPVPGRRTAAVDVIPVALVVLVASTGVSITLGQVRQARSGARRSR